MLRKVESLDVNIVSHTRKDKKQLKIQLNEQVVKHVKEAVNDIEKERSTLLKEFQQKNQELSRIKNCKQNFLRRETIPLRELKQGSYTVKAAKRSATRFGQSYKLLIEHENGDYTTWCNTVLNSLFEKLEHIDIVQKDNGFLTLDKQSLGILQIRGKGTNGYGNVTVYADFTLNLTNNAKTPLPTPNTVPSTVKVIATIPREELLPYREYANITALPVGGVYKVESIGHITHYGTSRMVLRIADTIYQAGQDLEANEEQITPGCSIRIEKIRQNRGRHVKYAVCKIVQKGDWAGVLDYNTVPVLPAKRKRGCCEIIDVKAVEHGGEKRKLVLTSKGDVYKIKKSKLEERLTPGQIYEL